MALKTLRPRVATLDTRCAQPPPKVADRFYDSPEWRFLVRRITAERGARCEDCGSTGRLYADHVHELQDGGAPLDPANVLLRCASCHGRKTAQARADRLRA